MPGRRERIGIVGVGRMGLAMLGHLVKAGYAVTACDISHGQCDKAKAEGAAIAVTPAVLGRMADVVILGVGYDEEVELVTQGPDNLFDTMGRGSVIAVSATVAPDTVKALAAQARDNGVDPARIAVAGESAGGGCAVALALHARDRIRETGSGPSICFQLLDYPMLDDRTGHTGDIHPFAGEFVWTPEHNKFGWSAMLGMEAGGAAVPEAAVPARRADLSDLPPAFVILGALDLFLEENLEYVRRLTRVGVPVELHVIPGAYHGFTLAQGSPQVALATQLRHQALGRAWRL